MSSPPQEPPPQETPPQETPPQETPPQETPPQETPPQQATTLDSAPMAVVLAFLILAACGAATIGAVLFGYAPPTSLVLGMVLLACAFSLLSGSPISLALIGMTGFLVVVSSMVMVREIPEMRTGAQISAGIFVVVMGLALSQYRWFFRNPNERRRNRP